MLQRRYVHNFRCRTNFEWSPADTNHHLLLGKNGAGKSSLGAVLAILQKLGQGKNRVEDLLLDSDFGYGNMQIPLRLEIQVKLDFLPRSGRCRSAREKIGVRAPSMG